MTNKLLPTTTSTIESSSFPFTTIILTFPTKSAADTSAPYLRTLLSSTISSSSSANNVEIIITSDPYNLKLGSGGGTLAALSLVTPQKQKEDEENDDEDNNKDTILIIHAGGDSSRCPNQMIVGKAWTSLPNASTGDIDNPIVLLIQSLSNLFYDVPKGSVIVAASDCILHLPKDDENEMKINYENVDVLGVAVPAPYYTAKNHGVYICKNNTKNTATTTTQKSNEIQELKEILQKPTVQELQNTLGEQQDNNAWIDTGIIIFFPKSVLKLKQLLQHTSYSNYTHDGISKLLQKKNTKELQMPKIDLYTHILHAIGNISHKNQTSYKNTYPNIDIRIYEFLNDDLSLKVLTIPKGSFIHLGTTKEYMDYILDTTALQQQESVLGDEETKNMTSMSSKKDDNGILNHRCYTYLPHSILKQSPSNSNNVIYSTLIESLEEEVAPSSSSDDNIGKDDDTNSTTTYATSNTSKYNNTTTSAITLSNNSILEHCHIILQNNNNSSTKLEIHSNSLLSCINCIIPPQTTDTKSTIGSNMLLHQIPISKQQDEYIWIYLGINDKIKSWDTIYNIPVKMFLQDVGLTIEELFDIDEKEYTIWNAKLHVVERYTKTKSMNGLIVPILNNDTSFPFQWISDYILNQTIPNSTTISKWKCSKRMSLKEIASFSQYNPCVATVQLQNQFILQSNIIQKQSLYETHLKHILLGREHKPIQLVNPIGWDIIKSIIFYSLARIDYDITSRCFMILSNWCVDILNQRDENDENNDSSIGVDVTTNQSSSSIMKFKHDVPNSITFKKYCYHLLSLQQTHQTTNHLQFLVQHYEEASSHLTRACIGNAFHFDTKKLSSVNNNQWVVVTAPARVDVSGGWSDTPPISYEYGGAVANLSVTIDGKCPFLVKCRRRKTLSNGGAGLVLITQDLVCRKEVHVQTVRDLIQDCRNPLHGEAVLVKVALICLGLVPLEYLHYTTSEEEEGKQRDDQSIIPFLKGFLGDDDDNNNDESCTSIEIISISNLPQGSGMGSSSILGGCIIAAIGTLIGLDMNTTNQDDDNLTHAVLALEQIMTTGGGWQDQIGGLIGGFKLTKSLRNQISPLSLSMQVINPPPTIYTQLAQRLVLVYTGKSRLAKNILQNVLRRWNTRNDDIMSIVRNLVAGADDATLAFKNCDINALGVCLCNYWEQKKIMAGGNSNVEPSAVKKTFDVLYEHNEIIGGSLCGAGGGGFMVLMARDGQTGMELKNILEEYIKADVLDDNDDGAKDCILNDFTWHTCEPVEHGLLIDFVDVDDGDE